MVRLFKDTVAYRIVSGDKKKNSLSHAYLLLCQDGAAIPEYLKTIAKTIICEDESGFCDQCRSCSLIERNLYTDVSFYPKGDGGKNPTSPALIRPFASLNSTYSYRLFFATV